VRVPAILTLIIPMAFLGLACNESSTRPPSFLDQTIVLEASDWVTGTETGPNEFTYDLSSLSLVANGTFNDIEVSYITPNATDEPVHIYNFAMGEWDQVGFLPPPWVGGVTVTTTHYQTVRDLYGTAQPYIDPTGMLRVWGEGALPREVRVLRLRGTYVAARPIGNDNVNSFEGLTYDGVYLWASSSNANRLYLIDGEGTVASEFDIAGDYGPDLAFDGENVWLPDGSDRILRMSLDGAVTGEFTMPRAYACGLAWGDGSLWLAECYGVDPLTFRIDADASCAGGTAVVLDTFPTPGRESYGLAWDGQHLLVLSDALYVVNSEGTVVQSYSVPVSYPGGLAWDGQAVAMFSRGPADVGNSGVKLNWFRLR